LGRRLPEDEQHFRKILFQDLRSQRARGAESRGSMDKAGQVWEAWQELVIGRADPIVVMTTSMLAIAAVPVALTWLSMRRHKKREGKKEDEEAKPEAKPSHHGNLTKEELKEYTGKDSSKPLLVAINGKIYDVTSVSQTLSLARARAPLPPRLLTSPPYSASSLRLPQPPTPNPPLKKRDPTFTDQKDPTTSSLGSTPAGPWRRCLSSQRTWRGEPTT